MELEDASWTVYGTYEKLASAASSTASGTVPGSNRNSNSSSGQGADSSSYAFVGYATTYTFSNPARPARPLALRLAQLLLLPAFQRAGHGLRLMRAIQADAEREDVFEVTVESPCPGMAALRDVFSMQQALERGAFGAAAGLSLWKGTALQQSVDGTSSINGYSHSISGTNSSSSSSSSSSNSNSNSSSVCVLPGLQCVEPPSTPEEALSLLIPDVSAAALEPARLALRCTYAQLLRALEALTLARLGPVWRANEEISKKYRLWVKRRIFAADSDIRALVDVNVRKAALELAFDDAYAEYLRACGKLGLIACEEVAAALRAYASRVEEREREAVETDK